MRFAQDRGRAALSPAAATGAVTALVDAVPRAAVGQAPVVVPSQLSQILSKGRIRAALAILGPAFVASVAYVDPGNFASNFQAGAEHGYELAWVIAMASLMAILVQYLTAKLGIYSGQSLPEMCREAFPRRANLLLWMQAEVVAMATDLAEFTGAAIGLNLVFGIPLFPAGLITAVVAFGILMLEQRGYRRFELVIIALLSFVALGFLVDFFTVGRESYSGIARGMVPHMGGGDTPSLAVAIVGATVMPHVVYLHSALQKNRIRPTSESEGRTLLRYNRLDCCIGLGIAGLGNLAMLCIAASLFHHPGLMWIKDLDPIHSHLTTLVGGGAALAFGIALIASGLASSSVGTYAGQIVMAGFMNWRIPLFLRRVLTMIPSLVVLAIAVNTTSALVYSQIVLSFGIPFALVPLILLTRRRERLGYMVNRKLTTNLMWGVTGVIAGLNFYLLYNAISGVV